MVGHTQKVDYGAAEEAETAGSLLAGAWPEVVMCGSSWCQGESWTPPICEEGKRRGVKGEENQKIRALVRFPATFLLFLDYSELEDCSFVREGFLQQRKINF